MNKGIQEISWRDLVGKWSNEINKKSNFEFTICEDGKYELYNFAEDKKCLGKIDSEYLPVTNTVKLILENYFDVELFQLMDGNILLHFNNNKLWFKQDKII